ncbi:MAG: hemerythrin domain-containing protein, partial [Pseudonocardiales bacterium]
MNGASQDKSEPDARGAGRPSLRDEHALMMREVTSRAHAVTSEADEGRWPKPELRELLNYLHLEVLRQFLDEEWLLFRVVRHAPEELARLRRDHLELRLAIEVLDQAAATNDGAAGWS